MIRGVILSHTPIGRGFCTNISVRDPVTGVRRQIRPRLPPNDTLQIGSFGYSVADMTDHWQPGNYVDLEGFTSVPAGHERSTHPEDVNVTGKVVLYTNGPSAEKMKEIHDSFTFPSLRAFMPPLVVQSNSKATVLETAVLTQSVGYVRMASVRISQDFGKYVVRTMDHRGLTVAGALKDSRLLSRFAAGEQIPLVHRDVLVRFSLSGYFDKNPPCWLMVSHIVGV